MLVLGLKIGEEVALFENNKKLGTIKFVKSQRSSRNDIRLGFDLPNSIQILRDSLITGKETKNA